MFLIAAVPILFTALLSPPADGAFVGTFVVADTVSLVVRGSDGAQVAFVLDDRSEVPAGFVPGTPVVVRFEIIAGAGYRAVSVGPARIPWEPEAVTVLPPVPGQGGGESPAAPQVPRAHL